MKIRTTLQIEFEMTLNSSTMSKINLHYIMKFLLTEISNN